MQFSDGLGVRLLERRRRFNILCKYFRFRGNPGHSLETALPSIRVPVKLSCHVVSVPDILMLLGLAQCNLEHCSFLSVNSIRIFFISLSY